MLRKKRGRSILRVVLLYLIRIGQLSTRAGLPYVHLSFAASRQHMSIPVFPHDGPVPCPAFRVQHPVATCVCVWFVDSIIATLALAIVAGCAIRSVLTTDLFGHLFHAAISYYSINSYVYPESLRVGADRTVLYSGQGLRWSTSLPSHKRLQQKIALVCTIECRRWYSTLDGHGPTFSGR